MGSTPSAVRIVPPIVPELIATKLTRPRRRAGQIARQRLIEALAAGQASRVTVIEAPTGYGKTTPLVSAPETTRR